MMTLKLLALVLLSLHSAKCEEAKISANSEDSMPRYYNAPYSNQNYAKGYQQSPAALLDTSCQRYTCTPTTSPVANCALVCSPDRRTPFCPILYCTSATASSCANFKCLVQQPHSMFANYY